MPVGAEFYLGTHQTDWLKKTDAALFVSARRLQRYKRALPAARGKWYLDSGGFTELNLHGRWVLDPLQYVSLVQRYRDEIGNLGWAAPQDWMCEPTVLRKTGLTIAQHQRKTVDNYLRLMMYAPHLPFIPVLQGWSSDDYMRCVEMYDDAGVHMEMQDVVGIGTVCRRQGTKDAEVIIHRLWSMGIPLHVFGLKLTGLRRVAQYIVSGDSMAWSFAARRRGPLPCHTHKTCANCLEWALKWRKYAISVMRKQSAQPQQMLLSQEVLCSA